MNIDHKLSRGPIVILISSTIPFIRIVIIPIIQAVEINVETIVTAVIFIIGAYLTITDYKSLLQMKINNVQKQIKKFASSIILDTTMKEIFSLDCNEGLLGCALGTSTGIVGLYTLPFSPHQRAQILQSFLPSNLDAKQIFFTPGGFWKSILSDKFSSLIVSGKENCNVEAVDSEDANDKRTRIKQGQLLNDLSWDDATNHESHETEIDTSLSDQTESDGNLSIRGNTLSIIEEESNMNTSLDPLETLKLILQKSFRKMLHENHHIIDEKILGRIGFAAFIALLIQLRSSSSARRMTMNSIHFLTTCTLTGILCSSVGLIQAKGTFVNEILNNSNYLSNKSDRQDLEQRFRSNLISPIGMKSKLFKCLLKCAESFQEIYSHNVGNKQTKRKQFKAILAALVLYIFHRRRKKSLYQ